MARKNRNQNVVVSTEQTPMIEQTPIETIKQEISEPEVKAFNQPVYKGEYEEMYFLNCRKNGLDYFQKGEWHKHYARFIQNAFKITDKKILDLGCAAGAIASAFKDNGASEVLGIDVSKFLTTRSPFKNILIKTGYFWDVLKNEEKDKFDFIHSSHALNTISDEAVFETMKLIKEVSKDGAIIFITGGFKNKQHWLKVAGELGMKDGSKGYQEILNNSGNFMQEYKWEYLVLKVVK